MRSIIIYVWMMMLISGCFPFKQLFNGSNTLFKDEVITVKVLDRNGITCEESYLIIESPENRTLNITALNASISKKKDGVYKINPTCKEDSIRLTIFVKKIEGSVSVLRRDIWFKLN